MSEPLLRAMAALDREELQCDGDERTGIRILKRALEAPTRQIAEMRNRQGNIGFRRSDWKVR